MTETLSHWQKILEGLGFEHKYYDYLDCELVGIDWYKGKEHIYVGCSYTEEYWDYIHSLLGGTEFEPDWSQCMVNCIKIYTDEFAYPEGHYEGDRFIAGITLSDYSGEENFCSLTEPNFRKALEMSRHPIQAKLEIVRKFLNEMHTFFAKHGKTLEDLGWKECGTTFLPVGTGVWSTEPYLDFSYDKNPRIELDFNYNLFTEQLEFRKYIPRDDPKRNKPYNCYLLPVNDLSIDNFREEIITFMKEYYINVD